ncbi:MAG: PocR ligand-binding domain-containing protein, partial [Bryobacteraceae bacterium]
RHEAESCAVSDRAAELRVRKTGNAEVYRCHAGLVDIAVPVICEGRHIATLFTGQVLREPPDMEQFVQIRQQTAALTYIDLVELEKAYFRVPVVSGAEIEKTIQILEVFAEYLAVSWKRLSDALRQHQKKAHELQVQRKEFALMLLEGQAPDSRELRDLMDRIGFKQYPNRMLVVALETGGCPETGARVDVQWTVAAQAVEELCSGLPNICPTYLRGHGICVFFRDRRARGTPGVDAQTLAAKILQTVSSKENAQNGARREVVPSPDSSARRTLCASRSPLAARVGVGCAKDDWRELADSYHEACMALASSLARIAIYTPPSEMTEEVSASVHAICRAIADRRFADARMRALDLPRLVSRQASGCVEQIGTQRYLFIYALDAIEYTAREMGAGIGEPGGVPAQGGLNAAGNTFELQDKFTRGAQSAIDRVRTLYAGRPRMLIDRASGLIEQSLKNPIAAQNMSVGSLAAAVGVSADYLSRMFKKSTALTLERYLMTRRIAAAEQMLLEPLASVAEVSENLGFSDPAYFARVFRKIAGCSPRAYRDNPLRIGAPGAANENGQPRAAAVGLLN